jgi:uncharacterized RDD family membrane protein YckC
MDLSALPAMDVNYKIIGGDGVEYGPATLAEIQEWIRDGRVAWMSRVWRSDLASWSPADRYTELRPDLARLQEATAAARELRPCGFWARLAAHVLDQLIWGAIFFAIWTPIAQARHWALPTFPQELTDATVEQFRQQLALWMDRSAPVLYPVFLLYDVLLTGRFGATIGKWAIGARVTMKDGSPIGYNRALLRWLASRLSDLTFGFGYLLIAMRPDKRALHDLLAGTKVVYKR